jgi:hypothetical protein
MQPAVPVDARRAHADARSVKASPRDDQQPSTTFDRAICCKQCGTPITWESAAMSVQQHHQHTRINPAGVIYSIWCFAQVKNVVTLGAPSCEFPWFAGHSWVVVVCGTCQTHLGWRFDAPGSLFYGLIADRLVEST